MGRRGCSFFWYLVVVLVVVVVVIIVAVVGTSGILTSSCRCLLLLLLVLLFEVRLLSLHKVLIIIPFVSRLGAAAEVRESFGWRSNAEVQSFALRVGGF